MVNLKVGYEEQNGGENKISLHESLPNMAALGPVQKAVL